MDERISLLFREVADLPPAERESVFARRHVSPELRAEVESLLASDARQDHALTECIGRVAEQLSKAHAAGLGGFCGPYRLIRLLGVGGMGAVYLAERSDGEIQQQVAIKMLRLGADGASWQQRFLRERQLLAYLNHPSVTRLLDASRTDRGQPYLVMEYVQGVPIDVYAKGRSLREQLTLFLKVCEGVAHAHGHLIIHRDLKPQNILVDPSGQPKLLDFGIAKVLDETGDHTQTVERLLTPSYASPEQLRGTIQTTASDVYSLGAVLYKMLTGRSPHESEAGELQTLEIVAGTREIPSARRLNPSVPGDVDSILQKTLRMAPKDRYVSVEAFANDVQAFLESRPVQARSGDAWYRARKFLRRYWIPVTAASLVLASLAVGLYIANRERALAQRRFSEVRQLSNKLFEIDREASEFPGSTKTRQLIVDTALEYLQRLAADAKRDPALALELGNAYLQVARVQGVPIGRNLGQMEQAGQSLRLAEVLVRSALDQQPGNRNALLLGAAIAHDQMLLAALHGGRRDLSRRAIVLGFARKTEALLDQFGAGSNDRSKSDDVLNFYMNVADQFLQARQLDDALRVCRRASDLARAVNSRVHLGMFLWVSAEVLQQRGDLNEAAEAIRESVRLVDPGAGNTDTTRTMVLAHVLIWEGRILGQRDGISLGRDEEAVSALEHAFRITDAVVHVDANDQSSRARLAMAGIALGEILSYSDARRAEAIYEHTLSHLGEVQRNNVIQRFETETLVGSSYALRRLGRSPQARERLDAAFERLRELNLYPSERVAAGSAAYKALCALADLESARGDVRGAVDIYENLLVQVQAANIDPQGSLDDAVDLSNLYRALAELDRSNRKPDRATALAALRLELWQNWDRKLPNNPYVGRQLVAAAGHN